MIDIELPSFEISTLAATAVKTAELPREAVRDTFIGAKIAILRAAIPLCDSIEESVSESAGVHLHTAYAFSWVYQHGAELAPHLDRDRGMWSVSVPLELDAPWALDALIEEKWVSRSSEVGRGTLINGGAVKHRRLPYKGFRAIVMILSFRDCLQTANMERDHHGTPREEGV